MIGANLTTQVLKHVRLRPTRARRATASYGNTLPSGHTTAAASVSAALLLVVPPRVRPWAAVLGAGYTTATGISTLIGQWHRPSDVVAAVLVVLAWTAIDVRAGRRSRPHGATTTGALRLLGRRPRPGARATMRLVVSPGDRGGRGGGSCAAVALSHDVVPRSPT